VEVGQLLSHRAPSRRIQPLVAAAAAALFLVACGGDDDGEESSLSEPTSPSSIDAPAEVDSVPAEAPEVCDVISDELITDLTGASVVGIEGRGDTCTWTLTESAAVLDGPNEDGEATLELTLLDPEELAAFEANDEPGVDVVPVDDVGDDAFLVRRDGIAPTTLFVRDGDRAMRLALANVLDGAHATEQALTDLADQVLEATS
jgi:hypothetical protein